MISKKRKDTASCPFCQAEIPRPAKVFSPKHTTFEGGKCACGAVFLVDVTGRNLGEVLLNAMSIVGIADKMYDVEYQDKIYLYDQYEHKLTKKKRAVRYKGPKILFLRLN